MQACAGRHPRRLRRLAASRGLPQTRHIRLGGVLMPSTCAGVRVPLQSTAARHTPPGSLPLALRGCRLVPDTVRPMRPTVPVRLMQLMQPMQPVHVMQPMPLMRQVHVMQPLPLMRRVHVMQPGQRGGPTPQAAATRAPRMLQIRRPRSQPEQRSPVPWERPRGWPCGRCSRRVRRKFPLTPDPRSTPQLRCRQLRLQRPHRWVVSRALRACPACPACRACRGQPLRRSTTLSWRADRRPPRAPTHRSPLNRPWPLPVASQTYSRTCRRRRPWQFLRTRQLGCPVGHPQPSPAQLCQALRPRLQALHFWQQAAWHQRLRGSPMASVQTWPPARRQATSPRAVRRPCSPWRQGCSGFQTQHPAPQISAAPKPALAHPQPPCQQPIHWLRRPSLLPPQSQEPTRQLSSPQARQSGYQQM
jgi:hypothetical protein